MGGKVGLKGTDGPERLQEARRRGAVPVASAYARRALLRMANTLAEVEILAGAAELGEIVVHGLGLQPTLIGPGAQALTTAHDTRIAATDILERGADLILFAGGDGTARDIVDVIGSKIPILGVPAGVKMHSAVFATNPENAGDVAARFLSAGNPALSLRDAEIVDVEEQSQGLRVSTRLYGYARVPYERRRVQHAKAAARHDDDAALDATCREIAHGMRPGTLYLLGPGTTTQAIMRHAGVDGTLLGIDALCDGRLVGYDLDERAILALLASYQAAWVIISVIGGQGCLFGRGNQQISAEVIKRVGRDRILVVSGLDKLLALDSQGLFVDTGDAAADAMLSGYVRVQVSPGQSVICKVS
jgi:predicted polyphosphate/ATP-dependent NAD kinase